MKKRWLGLALILEIAIMGNNGAKGVVAENELESARSKFKVPASITAEHEQLHAELAKAAQLGGATGRAADAVARVLDPHFQKEELFALPALGLLREVSSGTVTGQMEPILPLTEKLKAELPKMLKEHKAIVGELDRLQAAAEAEKRAEVVDFVKRLKQHAQNEEEVLYPAAILVGEMIKARLERVQPEVPVRSLK